MHRFIPSTDGRLGDGTNANPAPDPAHTAAIKRWTREILGLPADAAPDDDGSATVIVTELACADAGCPLVETVIAVFEPGRARRWRFTRPRVAVTKLMLRQTLATPPVQIDPHQGALDAKHPGARDSR